MSVINGTNYNYTTNDLFTNKDQIIERTNLVAESNDTFPSFLDIKNALVSDVVGINYSVKIYNNSDYDIKMHPGVDFQMVPGPTDLITSQAIKTYNIYLVNENSGIINNIDYNGQKLVSDEIITNNIKKNDDSNSVVLFSDALNVSMGGDLTLYGNLFQFKNVVSLTADSNLTYTSGQILSGFIKRSSKEKVYDTLPTAAQIIGSISNCRIGTSFNFILHNNGDGHVEIQENDGITISGKDTRTKRKESQLMTFVVDNVQEGSEALTVYLWGTTDDASEGVVSSIRMIQDKEQIPYSLLSSDNTLHVDTRSLKGVEIIINLPEIEKVGQKRYFITDISGAASDIPIYLFPYEGESIMRENYLMINSDYSSVSMYNDEVSNWILF